MQSVFDKQKDKMSRLYQNIADTSLNQSGIGNQAKNLFNRSNAGFIFPQTPVGVTGKVNLNSNFFSKNVFKKEKADISIAEVDGIGKEKKNKQFLFANDELDEYESPALKKDGQSRDNSLNNSKLNSSRISGINKSKIGIDHENLMRASMSKDKQSMG